MVKARQHHAKVELENWSDLDWLYGVKPPELLEQFYNVWGALCVGQSPDDSFALLDRLCRSSANRRESLSLMEGIAKLPMPRSSRDCIIIKSASLLRKSGDLSLAEGILSTVIDKTVPRFWLELCKVHRDRGNMSVALELLDKQPALHPLLRARLASRNGSLEAKQVLGFFQAAIQHEIRYNWYPIFRLAKTHYHMALFADSIKEPMSVLPSPILTYFANVIKITNKYDSVVMARSWSLFLKSQLISNSTSEAECKILHETLDLVACERVSCYSLLSFRLVLCFLVLFLVCTL